MNWERGLLFVAFAFVGALGVAYVAIMGGLIWEQKYGPHALALIALIFYIGASGWRP